MKKAMIRLALPLVLMVLTASSAFAAEQPDSTNKPDVARLQKERDSKMSHVHDISLAFAEQQMKSAYAKRDKAMFEHDRKDPNLSEKDQAMLDGKIAETDQKLGELEKEKSKNREDYSAAVQDYTDFVQANSDVLLKDDNDDSHKKSA